MNNFVIIILVIMIFVSAIEVVYARHTTRKIFVDIQTLEAEKNKLIDEWGRLQLEQSTWATNDRIESIAREELKMKSPSLDETILIKR